MTRLHAEALTLTASFIALCAAKPSAAGGCDPAWLTGEGVRGVNGPVYCATRWDPDGNGPLEPRLVIGGKFSVAGDTLAANIAMWDGEQWAAFGNGLTLQTAGITTATVYALAVLPTGELLAGGEFNRSGGATVVNVASWNGSAWTQFGQTLNGQVNAFATTPSGDLYAGGIFQVNDGVTTTKSIARWTGSAWGHVGAGMGTSTQSPVDALAVAPNGDIIAAGAFSTAGGNPASCVARWDGTSWSAFGPGISFRASALAFMPNGDLVAGGAFIELGDGTPVARVARWNGAAWSQVGAGFNQNNVRALAVTAGGDLIAGGDFTGSGVAVTPNIAIYNGSAWSAMPSGGTDLRVRALLALPDGDIVVGGEFRDAGGSAVNHIAKHGPSGWSRLNDGFNFDIRAIAAKPGGGAIAAGRFAGASDSEAKRIASWNGVRWSPLGTGLGASAVNTDEVAVLALPNGDVIVGGSFTSVGGVLANRVARWDGSTWSALGGGMNGPVRALAQMANGDIVAGGSFTEADGAPIARIARWTGSAWTSMGTIGVSSTQFVSAMLPLPNGDLIAGGNFSGNLLSNVARWNGSTWLRMGSLTGTTNIRVNSLALHPSGEVFAGGRFDTADGVATSNVARWDGTQWNPISGGVSVTDSTVPEVFGVAVLDNGDVVFGGNFDIAGGNPARNIARWNGSAWSAMGSGMSGPFVPGTNGIFDHVYSLALLATGELAAGGGFTIAGGKPSAAFARYSDSPTPWIAQHPEGDTVAPGASAEFTAVPAVGYELVAYQWRRNGSDVADGPGGASVGGGTVSGASGVIAVTSGEPVTLVIAGVQLSDAGDYTVVFSNACAQTQSESASLAVTSPPCPGDFNNDGVINTVDLATFLGVFGQTVTPGSPGDFNGDGTVNTADLAAFLGRFGQSCS